MRGHIGHLSTKQEKTLQEFRNNVQDILKKQPECDDNSYLLRWLRARRFDLKKSVAMFRDHITWREVNKVDTILEDFEPPLVMTKYFPGGLFGQDKEGSLIWFDPVGCIDLKGILMSLRKQDIIRSKVWLMEKIERLCKEKSIQQGRRVEQIAVIFDLENLGMKHLWKPGVDLFAEIASTFEKHYPEILKKAYVINAPRIFPLAYNLLRPFLNEETRKKVAVCGSNYKEVLLQYIDADQLPIHWGGTCKDPDGNPKCPSAIVLGGEVPKSFYERSNLEDITGFTQTSLRRRSSLELDFVVHKADSVIRWQFKTEGFDIGFGVYRKSSDQQQKVSDMEPIVLSQRVNSHIMPEDGSVQCKQLGTYVVRFDNTYSLLKSKKLDYLVEMLEPQTSDLDMNSQTDSCPEMNLATDVWASSHDQEDGECKSNSRPSLDELVDNEL